MTSTPQRYALAALILVGLWIVTYWLWPAPGEGHAAPGVTFADDPSSAMQASASAESEAPPVVRDPLHDERPVAQPAASTEERTTPPVETSGAASAAPVVAPRFTEYTVERGDDMWKIARKVYGDRDRWDAIAKANPTVDPQKLRAGQV
ncbi:MAG: LysM peptidoglycan-binding domain-containing protein, partial [Phycisphaerales bacterium]